MELGEECDVCGLCVTEEHEVLSTMPWGQIVDYVDPCIGKLPGVTFACCGHGEGNGYIAFENGIVLRRVEIDQVETNHDWQPGMTFTECERTIVKTKG